jgi:hypothetical protein
MQGNPINTFKSKINDPAIRGRIKRSLLSTIPSLKVLLLGAFFFFLGFFWTAQDPHGAVLVFSFGFLTGNMAVNFVPVAAWSWEYFRVQFIDFLARVVGNIFMWNMQVILICIFTGIAIIPSILLGLLSFSGSLLSILLISLGLKGFVMYLGLFHLHLEILAALLTIDAFISFYRAIWISLRNVSFQPFKDAFISFYLSIGALLRSQSFQLFKDAFKNEFFPLFLRITLILALAAVLEVFWSTWWVYVFTHPYISWGDFYTQLYYSRVY